MAFDGKNDNLKEALGEKVSFFSGLTLPTVEQRKNYTIRMKPSLRKKLDQVAKAQGFSTTSDFLEKLVESF